MKAMRKLNITGSLKGVVCGLVLASAVASFAHPPPPPRATLEQANAGTNNSAYITPFTLSSYSGGAGSAVTNFLQPVMYQSNAFFNYTSFFSFVYVTNLAVFNGKVALTSNLYLLRAFYPTNSGECGGAIDMLKTYAAAKTNNNFAITGLSGLEVGATNIQTVNRFWTNSAASAFTIAMDANFQNMNASEGNTLYVTNVGHLLAFVYPGELGTNFYFKSR